MSMSANEFVTQYLEGTQRLTDAYGYNPAEGSDSCGVGLVVAGWRTAWSLTGESFAEPGRMAAVLLAVVIGTGVFATNFFGAQLVEVWHDILHRIPVVSSIYSSVKQI